MSPTPPEAQAIESRKVQTLLKIRIEAPMSTISIQMIRFIFLLWSEYSPAKPPGKFFWVFRRAKSCAPAFSAGRLAGDMALMAMSFLLLK